MAQTISNKASFKKTFSLIKDYFLYSDQKVIAWLLLIGAGLCVVALVGVMFAFAWWTAGFWAVIAAKTLIPILISMGQFSLLAAAFVGMTVLKNYLLGKLAILWRNWLTKKTICELFGSENNYLDLQRFSSLIDNIAQRVQEDIKNFVDLTLNLAADFLKAILSLGAFTGTLWIVGGALSFVLLGLNIVIPGYLVWAALIVAILATVATHFIGKSLSKDKQKAEQAEAEFRQDLSQLNNEAENIAVEHAENYYKNSLGNKIEDVKNASNQKLNTQTKVLAFQSFYYQIAGIVPIVLAAPLGLGIGQLMQIAVAFGEVSQSLSLFVSVYENIASCRASIARITELKNAFEKNGLPTANPKSIIRKERDKNTIKIKNLDIMRPEASDNNNYIIRNLNMTLVEGEDVMIQGQSGLGKSTLIKVLSGSWQYGNGKISITPESTIEFLSQCPVIPYATFAGILSYPKPSDTYTHKEYITVLTLIKNMADFIPKLGEKRQWAHELSPGQKQRVSCARILLKKPRLVICDEITSSLDTKSENDVYEALKTLKNTTRISIGHRDTIAKHHDRILFFKAKNNEKEVEVIDITPPKVPSL